MTSEDWMEDEGYAVSMAQARGELRRHGVASEDRGGELWAEDVAYKAGDEAATVTWVKLALNSKAILEWLGY